MKYYIKDNEIQAFYSDGAIEIESPVREDGTILPKHKNLGLLEVDGDDKLAKYYTADYKIDTAKIQEELDLETYNQAKTTAKLEISRIKVTVSTGKEFYADPESRTDLSDAISIMQEQGLTSYLWKTTSSVTTVTLAEMVEARRLGLVAKGSLVGVN